MATQPFRIPETPDYAGFARQNAMLDFSPITNVMDKWDKQAQLDKENKRAEDQLGFQRERLGMDKEKFSDDRKKNLIESFGNVAMLYDPAKDLDGAQWTGIVNRYDAKMRAHDSSFQGSTPDYYDRVQGPKLILGDSKMAAQQLEYQMRKAADARASAQLGIAKATHDAAMTQDVNLPYADRVNVASRYFTPDETVQGNARYEQYLNTGKVAPRESNIVTVKKDDRMFQTSRDTLGNTTYKPIDLNQQPGITDPKDKASVEHQLRGEISGTTKDFRTVRDALGSLDAIAQQDSAGSDIALIFSYMKILDPNSVVRETEFATAQNAAGVPDQVRNAFNRALNGERLNPTQREDFLSVARRIGKQQAGQYQRTIDQYRDVAKRTGVDWSNVVLDQDLLTPGGGIAQGNSRVGNQASPPINAINEAKAAIARGAPRAQVIERLRQNGISVDGL